jgi:ABC-type dipeptide/oligopeptide/nickel transport system permease component
MLEPSFKLIDFLSTHRPVSPPRGRTLNLLYSALLTAVVLLALSIIVGILLMIFSAVVTYDLNHRVHDIMNTLLIGIPGLLLVGVLISTFFNDPQLAPQMQSNLGI